MMFFVCDVFLHHNNLVAQEQWQPAEPTEVASSFLTHSDTRFLCLIGRLLLIPAGPASEPCCLCPPPLCLGPALVPWPGSAIAHTSILDSSPAVPFAPHQCSPQGLTGL